MSKEQLAEDIHKLGMRMFYIGVVAGITATIVALLIAGRIRL